jgi:hypothetical protein
VSTPQVPTARISSHHRNHIHRRSPYELLLGCALAIALAIVATLAALAPLTPGAGRDDSAQTAVSAQQARGKATPRPASTQTRPGPADAASRLW